MPQVVTGGEKAFRVEAVITAGGPKTGTVKILQTKENEVRETYVRFWGGGRQHKYERNLMGFGPPSATTKGKKKGSHHQLARRTCKGE